MYYGSNLIHRLIHDVHQELSVITLSGIILSGTRLSGIQSVRNLGCQEFNCQDFYKKVIEHRVAKSC